MKSAALVKRSARSRTIQALEEKLKLLEMEEQVTALNTVPPLLVCVCGAHAAAQAKEEVLEMTEIKPASQSQPEIFVPKVQLMCMPAYVHEWCCQLMCMNGAVSLCA